MSNDLYTKINTKQLKSSRNYGSLYDELVDISIAQASNMLDVDLSFEYDAQGNVNKEIVHDSAVPPNLLQVTTYVYNAEANIETETVVRGLVTTTKSYEYNHLGQLVKVSIRKAP